MRHLRKVLMILSFVGVLATAAPGWSRALSPKPIWVAPKGEHIRFLRTGRPAGHFLVLTESKTHWYLRDVDVKGSVNYCISQTGCLQSANPLSPLNWKGDHVLVGVGRFTDTTVWPLAAVDCNLSTKKVRELPTAYQIITFLLSQPYSPDGKYIGWIGSSGNDTKVSIQALNLQTGSNQPVLGITGGYNMGWTKDGKLYAFRMSDGNLFTGSADALSFQRELHSGHSGGLAPDGSWALVVENKPERGFTVYVADMPNGKIVAVYNAKEGLAERTVEWSPDGQEAAINGIGKGFPLIVTRDHTVRVVGASQYLLGAAGVAILSPESIAVVENELGSQDRVVALTVTQP